jgi:glycosyltransferase involved in cell wall biosynthesis
LDPKKTPLVSILTPSFNQAAWLGDNLRSVACQKYPRVEQIVMDGGSTDGSVALLRAQGTAVTWHSEPDGGQAHAINKAFRESQGEIIGWINSDDAYFDCRVVADVVAYFGIHPEVDVIYGHAVQTTHDGRIIQVLWVPGFDRSLLGELDFIVQPAAFIRRSALSDPMLDESFHFAMDYELWLRLSDRGSGFARMDRVLAIDRHQTDRKSSTIKDVYRANLARLAQMYPMRLEPEWDARRSAYYRRQRIMGAFLIPKVRYDNLAFSAPEGLKAGLWKRQLFQRRSDWPEEYR